MESKNVLITGGAGFFGSKLTEILLNLGYNVTVYDKLMFGNLGCEKFLNNENYKLVISDITNYEDMENEIIKNDIVFHMAALVGENICKSNKDSVYKINTDATKFIVDTCNKYDKKIVFFSTCSNYGKTSEIVSEQSELNPLGLYSDSKIESENYIIKNSNNYLIARCSTLFGVSHRMRYDLTINQFIYEIFKGGKISVYGESAWRPYIHVDDACNIIIQLLDKNITGVYNIGHKSLNYTKKQIIDILKLKLPDFEIEYVSWDDPRDYQVNFNKLYSSIDYEIRYDINKSIIELTDYLSKINLTSDNKNNFNL
jgi:nucleoside-diphosphate-sugar epimerase